MTGYGRTLDEINHYKYILGLPVTKSLLEEMENDYFLHPRYRVRTMRTNDK